MSQPYLTDQAWAKHAEQLVERDLTVLRYVSELRFMTGAQLTRLCFTAAPDQAANARAARRALLRLVRLGALARLPRPVGGVRAGSAGFVYYLGPGGQSLAAERDWQPKRRRRRSMQPGTLFLRHVLAIAELHVLLVEADRSRRIELLELASEPSCHRTYDGAHGLLTLKPDSYVRLGLGDFEDSYFLEVDRGTEGSRAITGQLERYVAYRESGQEQAERGVFPRVLWLASNARRADVIGDCAAELAEPERELFRTAVFDQALVTMVPGDQPSTKGSEHDNTGAL
jgi:hypothetical protein